MGSELTQHDVWAWAKALVMEEEVDTVVDEAGELMELLEEGTNHKDTRRGMDEI